MKVLVCGGRDMDRIDAWNWLERNALDELSFASGLSNLASLKVTASASFAQRFTHDHPTSQAKNHRCGRPPSRANGRGRPH